MSSDELEVQRGTKSLFNDVIKMLHNIHGFCINLKGPEDFCLIVFNNTLQQFYSVSQADSKRCV